MAENRWDNWGYSPCKFSHNPILTTGRDPPCKLLDLKMICLFPTMGLSDYQLSMFLLFFIPKRQVYCNLECGLLQNDLD